MHGRSQVLSLIASCLAPLPQRMAAGDECVPGWTQTTLSFWAVHSAVVGEAWVGPRVRRPHQRQSGATFRTDAVPDCMVSRMCPSGVQPGLCGPGALLLSPLSPSPSTEPSTLPITRMLKMWLYRCQAMPSFWLVSSDIYTKVLPPRERHAAPAGS